VLLCKLCSMNTDAEGVSNILSAVLDSHSCLQEYNPIPACRNGLGPQFAHKKIHLSLPWGATGARDVSCTSML